MKLNESLEKIASKKKVNPDKNISIKNIQVFSSLGIRTVLIYLFFIFVVGKFLAEAFDCDNFYLVSIIIATVVNIYLLFDTLKKFMK